MGLTCAGIHASNKGFTHPYRDAAAPRLGVGEMANPRTYTSTPDFVPGFTPMPGFTPRPL
jgi:hypothetical protein